VLATFEDPNTLATVSSVTASLPVGGWGDGSPTAAATLTVQQIGKDPSTGDPIFEVLGSHTYAEEGTYTVNITVTTSGGVATALTPGTATVIDAKLTGTTGNEITGIEGITTGTVLLGTFIDDNQAATVADYTAGGGSTVVNWGDGSAPQTLTAADLTAIGTPDGVTWEISAAHTYTEEGTYAYTITVTDDGGASTVVNGSAIIADAALTAGPATLLTAHTGIALPSTTVVATFTDANTFATTADYTTIIDWGDGSPMSTGVVVATATPGVFDVEGGHTYAYPGVYTTLVTVHDDGGSQVVITGSATVTDLPVTGATKDFTSTEGLSTGVFVLASFTDPDTLATVADVNAVLAVDGWGDGTPTAAGVPLTIQQIGVTPLTSATDPGDPIFDVLGSHVYTEESPPGTPYALSVIVTTVGGATTTISSPPGGGVTVLDAPLSSTNGPEITGIEGSLTPDTAPSTVGTLLGSFTDVNQFATTADYLPTPTGNGGSVVVNWGDGSALQTLGATNLTLNGSPNGVTFTINASHDYVEEGTYAYTVTVTDDGGSVTTFTGSAIIADADLSPAATQPTVSTTEATIFPVPEFSPPLFSGPVAYFTDANPPPPTGSSTIADFTATIDWGDGTPITAGTIALVPGTTTNEYEVLGSHTYAASGVTTGTGTSGTYKIQVFIVDTGGSRLTVDNTATVADVSIPLTGALNPTSDSGLSTGTPDTTNVKQPDFSGTAADLSTVTLFATLLPSGTPFIIGQVEAGSNGSWNIQSDVPLADGHYSITATAIDQFGETTVTVPPSPVVITSNLLIDTAGPVIDGMMFNRLNGQVDFIISDPVNPDGSAPSGVWVNTLLDSSNYLLTKVHPQKNFPGKYYVTNVTATPDPTIPFAYDVAVTFRAGETIRGGYYLFTIRDSSNGNSSVQDLAENHLDGVFYGSFPSGNGINGSDFVAELQGYHNKIFAPQTIIGTASNANGGDGGPRVNPIHSGVFVPVIPRGDAPVFSTTTSAVTAAIKKSKGQDVVKIKHEASSLKHHHAKVVLSSNHPKGPGK
jgi:PKD repeat protein